MHRLLTLLTLTVTMLLAGCDLRQRFDSAEDRINAAMPLDVQIRQARERLAEQLSMQPSERTVLDNAWSARLRARAVSCSPDFTPSWRHSSDAVRAGVGNKACFAEFDRKLARWIGVQRVRLALAQPPATVGSIPPSITLQGHLSAPARDAAQAPVIVVTTTEGFELVALDGRSLFKERGQGSEVSLAPNGRLFAQGLSGVVRIRATDGGETLLELSEARAVHWLSPWFLGVRSASGKPAYVFSLRSAEEAPVVTSGASSFEALLPVPGNGDRFNVLAFMGLYQFEVKEQDGKVGVTLVAEKPGVDRRLASLTSGFGQFSADGKEWVTADAEKLVRLDLATLEVRESSFEPALVRSAAPTVRPDQFVIGLLMPGDAGGASSRNGNYLFDATAGTLARVAGAAAQRPIRYVAALKRLAQTSHPTLWLSEQLETAEAQPAANLINGMLEEANQLKLAQVQARSVAEDQRIAQSPALQAGSPLLPFVRDAQVEGVGIYEANEKIAQPGQSRSTGRVTVTVRRSAQPLVLVLCSYEPVQWQLKLEPGARLGAVLVGGYYDSSVQGAGDARVLKIGRNYAYQQEGAEFAALQREVTRWAGRPISLFQSGYRGTSYTVGGR